MSAISDNFKYAKDYLDKFVSAIETQVSSYESRIKALEESNKELKHRLDSLKA